MEEKFRNLIPVFLLFLLFIFGISFAIAANPVGPSSVVQLSNETKTASGAYTLNTSGGYISTINITATVQNQRWKAFVGYITGKYTLDDASGSTIYDWTVASVSGEVYATRNATTISWASIGCANITHVESENNAMSLTNRYDNITATFSKPNNHSEFFVGSVNISYNGCNYTTNTYVNNVSQSNYFREVALHTQNTIVYTTMMENDQTGYDSSAYDFQMLVPENGAQGWTGQTAYYLYVEVT